MSSMIVTFEIVGTILAPWNSLIDIAIQVFEIVRFFIILEYYLASTVNLKVRGLSERYRGYSFVKYNLLGTITGIVMLLLISYSFLINDNEYFLYLNLMKS
jgi:hypothetical protein